MVKLEIKSEVESIRTFFLADCAHSLKLCEHEHEENVAEEVAASKEKRAMKVVGKICVQSN